MFYSIRKAKLETATIIVTEGIKQTVGIKTNCNIVIRFSNSIYIYRKRERKYIYIYAFITPTEKKKKEFLFIPLPKT